LSAILDSPLPLVRLGIIGCGAIAESVHLPAALSSSLVQVNALCDTDNARLNYLAGRYGLGPIGFTDYRATFSRVDAVVLALPNYLHAPVGVEFLAKGIHVLCEKPLGNSVTDCRRLCEAAHSSHSVLAVAYVTRFYPSTEMTKRLIDGDFLGPISSFDYEFGTEGGWAPLSGYNLTRQTSGGGVLMVSGSHFIDRMLYFFSDLEVVRCFHDGGGGVEADCTVWLQGASNGRVVEGRVTVSKTHRLANRLRIVGEKGRLEIGEGQSGSVSYFPVDSDLRHELSPNTAEYADAENYFQTQLEDFVRAVQRGTNPRVTGEQGSKSVALIERCYEIGEALSQPWKDSTLARLRLALPVPHPV